MAGYTIDRLVRKEVSLGVIREKTPPQNHIGLASIAPFMDVDTDDVIFEYIKGGLQDGLAPARAEDAESELSQKDELVAGQGSASVIDWAIKDRYSASDVTRYREDLLLREQVAGINSDLNFNFVGRTAADFERRLARDDTLRRRKLDNRLEWLIMQAIETSTIAYNDGKIKFTVDYGRPSNQTDQAPTYGLFDATDGDFDPINECLDVQQKMYDLYGFRPHRVITSQKVLNQFWKSNKYRATLVPIVGGTPSSPIDPAYFSNRYGIAPAISFVEEQTGITFQAYDSVYRTRAIGSKTWVNNRFTSEGKMFFLPTTADMNMDPTTTSDTDIGELDDTELGFAKTLTSPHPEGNWSSGYYEWEDETRDPWMQVRGTGVKAFPVFPLMEYTYTMQVLS